VPLVDRRVELQSGIGACPCGLGDGPPQVAGLDRLADLAGGALDEIPVGVVDDAWMKSAVTRTELLEF
jgi:hypothetical protein